MITDAELETKVEVAFGADLTADAASWSYTDITRRTTGGSRTTVYQQQFKVSRGRHDKDSQPGAATCTFTVDNPDGAFTPINASSIWYPNVALGTPCRVSVRAGSPHLSLTGAAGSRAGTPDNAQLDITGDWTLAVELLPPIWVPPTGLNYELFGKFSATGNQRSIVMFVDAAGLLRLRWSTNGTAELDASSSRMIRMTDGGPLTLAAWLDVNNGAGGWTATFYTCRGTLSDFLADPDAHILGTPDTDTGVTSVFSSTAPLDIGDITGSGFSPYPGVVNRAQVRAGDPTTGAIRANPDFTIQADGATGFTDSAGRVWTVSSATVDRWRPRFHGEISNLAPAWTSGDMPAWRHVDVDVSGPIRRLQQGADTLDSALFRAITSEINEPDVVEYWPFEDGRDATVISSGLPGGPPMRIVKNYSMAADDSLPASRPLLSVSSGNNAYMSAPIRQTIPQVPGVNWQVTRFFRIDEPAADPAFTQLLAVDTNGRVETWRISINDVGVFISGRDGDGASVVSTSMASDDRFFNTWAMIMLDITDDGVNVDWIVAVIPIPLGASFSTSGTFVGNTGVPYAFRNSLTGPPSGVSVGHLIVSTGKAPGWLGFADTAYVGEASAVRVRRLCEEEGINVVVDGTSASGFLTAPAEGLQPMGPQRPIPLLDLLAECAAVDAGLLGEQRHRPGLLFRTGESLLNQDPALTLDFSAGQVPGELQPLLDDQRYRNDITVSRTDGGTARVVDGSIDAGTAARYTESFDVNAVDDQALPSQASWRLHERTWPGMRYPTVTPDVMFHQDDLADDWLNLTEGDLVRVTNLPDGHPPGDVDLIVEGSTDLWEQYRWVPEIACTSAGPYEVGVRDDDTLGKRDTAGSELDAGIDDNDTSATVATTLGPLWSDDAAEDPFDIEIGGEQITVTNVTGTTSPQTFTLTRSVNGVVKSHAAGAPVRLWRPTVRAF